MAHIPQSGSAFHAGNALNHSLSNARIVDATGRQASIVSLDQGSAGTDTLAWVRIPDGPQIQVPVSLLELQADGSYRLPFAFDAAGAGEENMHLTFPVIEEQLQVGKRTVDTGAGVRIHKTVSQREQVVDEALLNDELVVERVPIDQLISASGMPETRYEGSTLVVPVLEEVLVVEKKLRLKEEIRITRLRRETRSPQTVILRSEQIDVERFDEGKPRQA